MDKRIFLLEVLFPMGSEAHLVLFLFFLTFYFNERYIGDFKFIKSTKFFRNVYTFFVKSFENPI